MTEKQYKDLKKAFRNADRSQPFSVNDLQRAKWFPYSNRKTIIGYIESKMLKARKAGIGRGKRYMIEPIEVSRFYERLSKRK